MKQKKGCFGKRTCLTGMRLILPSNLHFGPGLVAKEGGKKRMVLVEVEGDLAEIDNGYV